MGHIHISREMQKKKCEVVAMLNQAHAMKTYGVMEVNA
jgi:hypothetical protein